MFKVPASRVISKLGQCNYTIKFVFCKKNPQQINAGGLNFKINYLCFLVLNFPPLISCSKKEPSASPTLVKVTPVAPS